MKRRLLAALGPLCGAALCGAALYGAGEPGRPARPAADRAYQFHPPVRLTAGGAPVRVERPGYAAPCWADVDGDGKPDLLVGQFQGGKIRVFKGLGGAQFAEGAWLKAGGKTAEVPGVW
jgi:hypothetical protein